MVAPPLTIAFSSPLQAPEAIALFDDEFIHARGRSISFAQRFGDVFSQPESLVAVGRFAGDVAAALLVRPFSWQEGARAWRGAMIGLVCTRPALRGRGYAAALLAAAEARCRALGFDFGVLWALHDGLYARQGWIRSDCGMLGVRRAGAAATGALPGPLNEPLVRRLHALHDARDGPRVPRLPSNYGHLLPPAENMSALAEGASCVLCGWHGRTGYVHDIVGADADLPRLWDALAPQFGELYVNVERGSAAHRWLAGHADLEWTQQSLAMWKPFRAGTLPFAKWHIPFLDRI